MLMNLNYRGSGESPPIQGAKIDQRSGDSDKTVTYYVLRNCFQCRLKCGWYALSYRSVHTFMKSKILSVSALFVLGSIIARATPVTVEDIGMVAGEYKTVYIKDSYLGTSTWNVYAGVVDLKVN